MDPVEQSAMAAPTVTAAAFDASAVACGVGVTLLAMLAVSWLAAFLFRIFLGPAADYLSTVGTGTGRPYYPPREDDRP